MKVQLKRIQASSVVFSAYPLALFVVGIVYAMMNAMYSTYATVSAMLTNVLLMSIAYMFMLVVASLFFVLIYNLLCSMGVKGLVFELEDKEEKVIEE